MARTQIRMDAAGLVRLRAHVDEKMLRPITDGIAEDARRYVPVLSGDLLSTIHAEHLAGEGRVWCGDVARGIDYHLYQEFGTSRMAAQPYMRPALYKRRSVIR